MDRSAEAVEGTPDGSRCWCCDIVYPAAELTHLGAHPEVAVCQNCARFLYRRAGELPGNGMVSVRVRRATRVVRERVVANRLHERRFVGPLLRWLDRFLP